MKRLILTLIVLGGARCALATLDEYSFETAEAVARHVQKRDTGYAAKFIAPGEIELPAPFSVYRAERARWTFDFHEDLSAADGIEFELYSPDLTCFCGFSIYVNSGSGCFTGTFKPLKEGEWHRVVVRKSAFGRTEGKVEGWSKVKSFTLAGWRAGTRDSFFRIRNIRVRKLNPQIVVVRGDTLENATPSEGYAAVSVRMVGVLERCGVAVSEISDVELTAERLSGVRLVVLPWNPRLPEGATKVLSDYVAAGGKLFACYCISSEIAELLQVRSKFLHVGAIPGCLPYSRMRRTDKALVEMPETVDHGTACIAQAQLKDEGKVLAVWEDRNGGGAHYPAVIRTSSGYYVTHTWKNTKADGYQLLKLLLLDVEPQWKERVETAERRRVESVAEEKKWIASRKSKSGEWRSIGNHSPKGPAGYTKDEVIRMVKACGFTAYSPNIAQTGKIYDQDAREWLEVCHQHGLDCVFWKVCWHPHHADKSYKIPGRSQVGFNGKPIERWMCPSDPVNVATEVEDFVFLAKMKPDVLSIDYARYPGRDSCFCEGCRAAYEHRLGRAVKNWPADVRADDELAEKWTEFRCETITSFLRAISRRVRAECPGVKLKSSSFHHDVKETRRTIGQDWVEWCREGLLDILSPMDYYAGESRFAFKGLVRSQIDALSGTKVKICPGIGVSCWRDTGHLARQACEQIESIRELGLDSFGVFELDDRGIAILPELRGILYSGEH